MKFEVSLRIAIMQLNEMSEGIDKMSKWADEHMSKDDADFFKAQQLNIDSARTTFRVLYERYCEKENTNART